MRPTSRNVRNGLAICVRSSQIYLERRRERRRIRDGIAVGTEGEHDESKIFAASKATLSWTFESFWDPYTEPWFGNHDPYVCHEMLHTFGYDHGGEMSQLEWRAEEQYRNFRWYAVDTGEWPVWQVPLKGEKK